MDGITIYLFLLGSIIGSFLNVVIYRMPRGESIVKPGSRCNSCGTPIKWYDNVPLVSWLILKGRCRNCHEKFSIRYPLVELITAMIFISLYVVFGLTWLYLHYLILALVLFSASLIDIEHQIIPNRIVAFGFIAGLFLVVFKDTLAISDAAIGSLVMGGFLLMTALIGQFLLKKEAMGLGDVKFSGMIGLFIGWKPALLAILLSSLFASIFGLVAIRAGRLSFGKPFPFGPFIAAATLVTIFWGKDIIDAYLNWVFGRASL